MRNDLPQKLRKLISKSREIPLSVILPRDTDRFVRKLSDTHWRPEYLLKDTRSNRYIAFTIIYDADYFPNTLSHQVGKAMGCCNFDFFFILVNELLLDIFEEECAEKGFGLILDKDGAFLLVRDAVKIATPKKVEEHYMGHYPSWVINGIREIDLGDTRFRTALNDFSKNYNKLKNAGTLDPQKEENLVKSTIAAVLDSDTRYTSKVNSFERLGRLEKYFDDIRDHYFHSFHIFLLGLLILNRYKEEFTGYYRSVFPTYKAFSIEFLWLLTSIFHDVGYPIAKLDDLREDIYGIDDIPSEKDTTNVWNNPIYKRNLEQLISFFEFSLSSRKHRTDWRPEVFAIKGSKIEEAFRKRFYDSHGVASCFRFLVDIYSGASQERNYNKRVFLVNHIYPAALSIALHDKKFRDGLSHIGVKRIKLSRFPFAVLLMYLDSLQEDKRNKFLCIEDPELLQRFEYNGKVIAIIDEQLATNYHHLGKWKKECRDFINFAECDGIKFEYPKILL